MWRRCMIQRAAVTTGLTITAQHGGEIRKPRSNCSMSLEGKKDLDGGTAVEEPCYAMK